VAVGGVLLVIAFSGATWYAGHGQKASARDPSSLASAVRAGTAHAYFGGWDELLILAVIGSGLGACLFPGYGSRLLTRLGLFLGFVGIGVTAGALAQPGKRPSSEALRTSASSSTPPTASGSPWSGTWSPVSPGSFAGVGCGHSAAVSIAGHAAHDPISLARRPTAHWRGHRPEECLPRSITIHLRVASRPERRSITTDLARPDRVHANAYIDGYARVGNTALGQPSVCPTRERHERDRPAGDDTRACYAHPIEPLSGRAGRFGRAN
jgi:hypothetical protein